MSKKEDTYHMGMLAERACWIVRRRDGEAVHQEALARINMLMNAGKDTPEGQELDLLVAIAQFYERKLIVDGSGDDSLSDITSLKIISKKNLPANIELQNIKWIPPEWWGNHGMPAVFDWSCDICGASLQEIIGGKKCHLKK